MRVRTKTDAKREHDGALQWALNKMLHGAGERVPLAVFAPQLRKLLKEPAWSRDADPRGKEGSWLGQAGPYKITVDHDGYEWIEVRK